MYSPEQLEIITSYGCKEMIGHSTNMLATRFLLLYKDVTTAILPKLITKH